MGVEGFDHIIIGPDPQRLQLVKILGQCCDHDDRRFAAAPDRGQHLVAVLSRQLDVQDHQIGAQHLVMREPGRAVTGADHAKTFAGEVGFEDFGNLGLVLDDQDQGIGHGAVFPVLPPDALRVRRMVTT